MTDKDDAATEAGAAPVLRTISRRLDQQKLTLPVALAFFAALALMCGAAALVGVVVHHLKVR